MNCLHDLINGIIVGFLVAGGGYFLIRIGGIIREQSSSDRDTHLFVLISSLTLAVLAATPHTLADDSDDPLFGGRSVEVVEPLRPCRSFGRTFVFSLGAMSFGAWNSEKKRKP